MTFNHIQVEGCAFNVTVRICFQSHFRTGSNVELADIKIILSIYAIVPAGSAQGFCRHKLVSCVISIVFVFTLLTEYGNIQAFVVVCYIKVMENDIGFVGACLFEGSKLIVIVLVIGKHISHR